MKAPLRIFALALSIASLLCTSYAARADDKPTQPASVTPAPKSDPNKPEVAQKFLDLHQVFLKDKQEALKKGPIDLVFVGDSITNGWRRDPQNTLFNERWGKHNPLNLGIGGDRTQHVLWRLENGEVDGIKPKLVVLLIGTNNLGNKDTAEDTIAGVQAVVAKLREKLPESKILLLAIFPRADKPELSLEEKVRQANESIAKLDDGGKHIKYLDIGPKFLTDGKLTKDVMPDLLHLSEKGYQIWADAIGATVDEMMR
jgi:lysophospholipase L1-like esterase